MNRTAWMRRLATNERGSSVVEYVGVTGIALIAAGLIIAAIVAGRYRIGSTMAGVHARQIMSFESGLGGQANTPAAMYPVVRAPALVAVRTLPVVTAAVPQIVLAWAPKQQVPIAYQPTVFAPLRKIVIPMVAVPHAVVAFLPTEHQPVGAQTNPFATTPQGAVPFATTPSQPVTAQPIASTRAPALAIPTISIPQAIAAK